MPHTIMTRAYALGLGYGCVWLVAICLAFGMLDALLGINNLDVWIVPANLLIVGAHFIPLAFVFNVPAYLVMGILWIVAIVGSMLLLPSTAQIGHIDAWTTIPSCACIVITWLTVLFLMTKEFKRVRLATQIA